MQASLNQATQSPPAPQIGTVTSKDGTVISYRQFGHGPGLVLVHGGMSYSQTHSELAEALADAFTVYVPDRRGRGLSGPAGKDYSMQKEVEDLEALLSKTGAHNVFGISAGGLVVLQALRFLPTIHKALLYEPALVEKGTPMESWVARYDREMVQGKTAAALITGMKGAQLGPSLMNIMPRWLLEKMTDMMMAKEDKTAKSGDVTWRMLAPTLHYDGQLASEMAGTFENFRIVQASVLLLGGSQSPAYLKASLRKLEKVLPHVRRLEIAGVGHSAPCNSSMRGQPLKVAPYLRDFFA